MTVCPNCPPSRTGSASGTPSDQVAGVLREALAQGRINADELEDRLSRAYGARTFGWVASAHCAAASVPATRAGSVRRSRAKTRAPDSAQTGADTGRNAERPGQARAVSLPGVRR
ncbi:MAG TPA: DUF1707 domain-containing protein [Trebonia sp.]|nr:DUF1707 domain-containing protein [Trebonia sp.]